MKKDNLKIIIIGIFAGFINGLFGSGGGTIVVPSLVFLIKLEDYKAHATAISIILPLSIISAIIYFLNHTISIKTGLLVAMGGMLGSYLGAKHLKKIPNLILRRIFGCVVIYAALRMMFK